MYKIFQKNAKSSLIKNKRKKLFEVKEKKIQEAVRNANFP